jgi:hypothetical protein
MRPRGGKGPRPGPHLAGPRAHFVMLTNRLTGLGPSAHKLLLFPRRPAGDSLMLIASQSKSTTAVSSQLGRSLA